mmetsp:Transcript_89313/g.254988  ORF Transcript_89313/g.254988 Transcript_89313/m.254988 type:complete len:236 (+) Transcript_89313:555-1262(+)
MHTSCSPKARARTSASFRTTRPTMACDRALLLRAAAGEVAVPPNLTRRRACRRGSAARAPSFRPLAGTRRVPPQQRHLRAAGCGAGAGVLCRCGARQTVWVAARPASFRQTRTTSRRAAVAALTWRQQHRVRRAGMLRAAREAPRWMQMPRAVEANPARATTSLTRHHWPRAARVWQASGGATGASLRWSSRTGTRSASTVRWTWLRSPRPTRTHRRHRAARTRCSHRWPRARHP